MSSWGLDSLSPLGEPRWGLQAQRGLAVTPGGPWKTAIESRCQHQRARLGSSIGWTRRAGGWSPPKGPTSKHCHVGGLHRVAKQDTNIPPAIVAKIISTLM